MNDYKGIVCRGSLALGTACKKCERCIDEMERKRRDSATGTTAICSYHYDKGLKTK